MWEEVSPITMGSGAFQQLASTLSKICMYVVCMYDMLISLNQFVYEEISPKRELKLKFKKKLDNEVILEGFNFQ